MAIDTEEKMVAWLRRFGYLTTKTPTAAEIVAAVLKMQEVYGLTTDGDPGPITRKAMNMFRCSHSDTGITGVNPNAVTGSSKKWLKSRITFAVDPSMVLGGDRLACMSIIRNGFSHYAPLTGLTFTEIDEFDEADIKISAQSHAAGMDGVGNILALSGIPSGAQDLPLRSTFDQDEPWNLQNVGPGIIMQAVWMHELGHLVGLSHSSNPDDMMSPYYTPSMLFPQRRDRQRLAALYGVPFIESSDDNQLVTGAYQATGIIVIRHDGGVAINLRDIAPM